MRSITGCLLATALLALGAAAPVQAAELVPVDTFAEPIFVTAPPDDPQRLFVVERGGKIRIVKDGERVGGRYLKVPGGVSTDGERGLLSMAFHPNYENNRLFYVFYTEPSGGDLRIDEFKRREADEDEAKGSSQRKVLEIEHSEFANHNGGQLQFGPDEHLYIATGDGGGGDDTLDNGQDKDSLLGKLLRIDPEEDGGDRYSVPGGNPFVGRNGKNEIYSYGLRNPFRFSFDRGNGDLTIGDVGQDRREEIDIEENGNGEGANFGWPCFEGTLDNNDCTAEGHDEPAFEYPHPSGGACRAVTGGYVVRSASLASELGRYIYGDFCQGEVRSISSPGGGGDRAVPGLPLLRFDLVSFGEDASGCPYVVSQAGAVSRIADDGDPAGASCAVP